MHLMLTIITIAVYSYFILCRQGNELVLILTVSSLKFHFKNFKISYIILDFSCYKIKKIYIFVLVILYY